MPNHFTGLDWIVLTVYFILTMGIGFWFWRKSRSSEGFTAAGRSLPGWVCGLSIFATYLSSISYLALPGRSFAGNWNPFVFSLAIPIATIIAVKWFVPYYRRSTEVSAYALLEKRFGVWARLYVSVFYLLTQIARMGVVMYLMALPMQVIFGWDIYTVILFTGISVTIYSLVGGITAVIWADAIQAIVLMLGALVCLAIMMVGMPEGPMQVFEIGAEHDKFSLGSYDFFDVSNPTFWVVLIYGLFINLQNFGIDQSFVQRYIASKSEREARKSLWLGGMLYVPMSAVFFLIGTSLFAYYQVHPEGLPEVKQVVAQQQLIQEGISPRLVDGPAEAAGSGPATESVATFSPEYQQQLDDIAQGLTDADIGDRVFPHFIAKQLPPGMTGLLIAAIFAAAMSTVSTSLNSSATLVMSDYYERFFNRTPTNAQRMRVLYGATLVWGVMGTAMALVLVSLTDSALDMWWKLASIFSGGMLSLFLLGMISRRAGNPAAVTGVIVGGLVIVWMVFSQTPTWPGEWEAMRSPFHSFMVIVIGTLSILLVGLLVSRFTKPRRPTTE